MTKVLEFRGTVRSVVKQLIPRMYVTTVEDSEGNLVEFDTHRDLMMYREGEQLAITVSDTIPEYRDGEDFLGRGTVVSIKEDGERFRMLISIGGLLFMFALKSKPPFEPTDKVYVKVAKMP